MKGFSIETNPDDILLGFQYIDGISGEGDEVKMWSFGFLFFTVNYIIMKDYE